MVDGVRGHWDKSGAQARPQLSQDAQHPATSVETPMISRISYRREIETFPFGTRLLPSSFSCFSSWSRGRSGNEQDFLGTYPGDTAVPRVCNVCVHCNSVVSQAGRRHVGTVRREQLHHWLLAVLKESSSFQGHCFPPPAFSICQAQSFHAGSATLPVPRSPGGSTVWTSLWQALGCWWLSGFKREGGTQ